MNQMWQLQEAKNKFSQVVEKAMVTGPQIVTKHGKETVVVLSYAEYRTMISKQDNLLAFFRNSPLVDSEIDLSRDPGLLGDPIEL